LTDFDAHQDKEGFPVNACDLLDFLDVLRLEKVSRDEKSTFPNKMFPFSTTSKS
jgi:hypothetical protein